ncbi:recombinase family protein [Mesorhizobium sp. M0590]|uniref:recombinase family protein n=1 Tax=Mesorhizobium sp. M0590 TaxID=2956966 RepID=UPI003339DDCB
MRDAVASGQVERLYVHAPDRLARRYAHQALLIDELRRSGVDPEPPHRRHGRG